MTKSIINTNTEQIIEYTFIYCTKYTNVINTQGATNLPDLPQHCHLSNIKIYKMFRLIFHIRTKISPYNIMPGWIVFSIELFLYKTGDISFRLKPFKSVYIKISRSATFPQTCFKRFLNDFFQRAKNIVKGRGLSWDASYA